LGYYSNLRISITKQDYLGMLEKASTSATEVHKLLDENVSCIHEYKVNNLNCVFIENKSIKYYEEFEEVKELEKYLTDTKSGYIFLRVGEKWNDIEYRNTAKAEELKEPFKFINDIEENAYKKAKIREYEDEYPITSKEYVFTDKESVLEYCEDNKEKYNYFKEMAENNTQLKLVLKIDIITDEAIVHLLARSPNQEQYECIEKDNLTMENALYYLGYADEECFLEDINEETILNDELEDDFELEGE
jgi:hypothetical protein